MGMIPSGQIKYKSPVEFIEHMTGKTVLSWKEDYQSLRTLFTFTDNTCTFVKRGQILTIEPVVFEPLPRAYCASCGETAHISGFNWKSQCDKTVSSFWEKVRKLYWHRYSKQ